jgi:hypothetical protein
MSYTGRAVLRAVRQAMPTWAREIMAIISKSQRAGVDKVVIQVQCS